MKKNKELRQKITQLESELQLLRKELYESTGFVLMYIKKSGKHTFVLHPKNQKDNLISSGWVVFSKEDFDSFIEKYEF
jgi:hypothetical protein